MRSTLTTRVSGRRFSQLLFCGSSVACVFASSGAYAQSADTRANPLPHLRQHGTTTQLVVDGRPYLILGGELGNSAATRLQAMEPVWPRLVRLHLNTVLVPAYWDLVEPQEGRFEFALVDGLIDQARRHNLRIVFLWFGSWKNSMSCYAPEWVKTDQDRFPRCEDRGGRGMEILSPLSEANVAADARAFAAFMRHLRQVDGQQHTVIMVQVENEVGMIPEARDWSAAATKLYHEDVPQELMDHLVDHQDRLITEFHDVWHAAGSKTSGKWDDVFGPGVGTEEIFTAWHFARYTNRVAEAGKAEYPLPMFVNAALIRPGYPPGRYPSGGPLPHLIDVWRAGAPAVDFLSPDIYFPNFVEWCRRYHRSGNPLFIPETARESRSAANVFYAIGQHDAIGHCPFAIDSIVDPQTQPLAQSYDLLRQLTPLILSHQGHGTMAGVAPDVPFDGKNAPTQQRVELGDYTLNVTYEQPPGPVNLPGLDPGQSLAGGLVICEGPDEYLVAGTGLVVTFATRSPGDPIAGIASIQEGRFVDGRWVISRWLGGDESHQGRHLRIPAGQFGIQRIKLYRYR
jgi:beta-galactosidase GanA